MFRSQFAFVLTSVLAAGLFPAAVSAAMCGSSPSTTSPGYWCENYCHNNPPYPISCSNSCCGWIVGSWGQTTCGQSPYPCGEPPPPSVCGDESCTGSETNGSCPVDCGNGGGPDENPTVPWVEEQFDAVDDDGTRMSVWFGVPFVGGPIFPNPVPLYPPVGGDWKGPYPSFPLQFASLDRCHIQGAQRLRQNPYFAYTGNSTDSNGSQTSSNPFSNDCPGWNDGGAHLIIARLDSKQNGGVDEWGSNRTGGSMFDAPDPDRNHINILMDQEYYHPGGFQVIGDYVAAGMDKGEHQGARIKFYDVSQPESPEYEDGPSFDVPAPGHRAEAVGIVKLATGEYLLAAGSEKATRLDFYLSEDGNLEDVTFLHESTWELSDEGLAAGGATGFSAWCAELDDCCLTGNTGCCQARAQGCVPLASGEGWVNYQGLNLLRESGTDRIFLVALGRTEHDFCGVDFLDGADYMHLFELSDWDDPGDHVQLRAVAERHMEAPEASFCAGAGIYIQPDRTGTIGVYATEHKGHDNDLRFHITGGGSFYYVHGVLRVNEFWP